MKLLIIGVKQKAKNKRKLRCTVLSVEELNLSTCENYVPETFKYMGYFVMYLSPSGQIQDDSGTVIKAMYILSRVPAHSSFIIIEIRY
jgi:hypothetical protein